MGDAEIESNQIHQIEPAINPLLITTKKKKKTFINIHCFCERKDAVFHRVIAV